jgi:thioredoxin 1
VLFLQWRPSQRRYGLVNERHTRLAQAPAANSGAVLVQHVRYTPTTIFQRGGKKVDEVIGKDVQRLADHFWLHSDA